MTLIIFNDECKIIHDHEYVQNINADYSLKAVYEPDNETALNDAIGFAIEKSEEKFKAVDFLPPYRSSFFIITDG